MTILLLLGLCYAAIAAYGRYTRLEQGCQEVAIGSHMFYTEMKWECPNDHAKVQ